MWFEYELAKTSTATDRLSVIWKSDLSDKIKLSFFQAAIVSVLLYAWITWTLTNRMEKKLEGNYTRMLRAVLNKSWRQHPTKHQMQCHRPSITKTIHIRRTRHARHCWRSKDELISDVLWTRSHERAKVGRPARNYLPQLCADTAWKTRWLQRTIETSGEMGSGKSVRAGWHDDDFYYRLFICQLMK